MYGLFKMTADYYWWEDLVCVSAIPENLESYHKKNDLRYPLISEKQSTEIRNSRKETPHYVIHTVKEI